MKTKLGILNYFLVFIILMIVWTILYINGISGNTKEITRYIRNYQLVAIPLNYAFLLAIHFFEVRMNFTYIFILPLVIHGIASLFTYLFIFVFGIFNFTDIFIFFYLTIAVVATVFTLKRTIKEFA